MRTEFKIAGLSGSIREASFSRILLDSLADMLPDNGSLISLDIGSLPHYSEDLEHGSLPEEVKNARNIVSQSDAVFIVTPEFNHGIPGVLKNTLDWLSRPAFKSPMTNKYVFFVTQSPGALGGVRAQYQLRETLAALRCKFVPLPEIAITHVSEKIQDGKLVDAQTISFINQQIKSFLELVLTKEKN